MSPQQPPAQPGPKLAILIHSMSAGGAERVTAHLAGGLAERGWQVALVTVATADKDFYRTPPGVRRVSLGLAGASAGLRDALRGNLHRLLAIRRTLREGRYDTVLAMTSEIAVVTILATIGLPIRVVVSERIHPPAVRIGRLWHRLRKVVYPWADEVVVLADQSRDWIERHARGARTRVIPNPVVLPLPVAEPARAPADWVAPERRLLLAVGRLSPQKGFDLLIDAFAAISPRFPDWTLVIVGEGQSRGELEAAVARSRAAGAIALPGHAGNLADWYRRADLFVLSSRFEGFPNVLAEAMAHGCPVVSFDCPTGPREIVRHDVDGLLVTAREDVAALAESLSTLMASDPRRAAMAIRAREIAERYGPAPILSQWQHALSPGRQDAPALVTRRKAS